MEIDHGLMSWYSMFVHVQPIRGVAMDIVKSVINRMGAGTGLILAGLFIITIIAVGGFLAANANRSTHTGLLNSIVDGCKGSPDFAKCVDDASVSVGINTVKQDMQKYIVDKCFRNYMGSDQDRCVNEVSQAFK